MRGFQAVSLKVAGRVPLKTAFCRFHDNDYKLKKDTLDMNIKDKTIELLSGAGISGYEHEFAKTVCKKLKVFCSDAVVTKTNSVLGHLACGNPEAPTIMLEAHLDRIGLIVKAVDENGFVAFDLLGGVDERILPSAEVWIFGKEGCFGVIGAKPPHITTNEESKKGLTVEDMLIDTGLGERAAELIYVGDPILLDSKVCELLNGRISSAALDNRVSMAAVFEILEGVKDEVLPVNLTVAFTSGEESGLLGAYTIIDEPQPDLAVVLDVTYGRTPDAAGAETFPLGSGAAIMRGPNVHYEMTKRVIEIAKEKGIPYEIEVAPRSSGTTAWAIQNAKSGVPCVVISIPLRYMHTTVETVDIADVEAVCRLVREIVLGGDVVA